MIKTKRVVIDANVIVSALIFSNSTTMQCFREAKQKCVILISTEILSELIDVLSRQKFDRYISREIREDFLASLSTEAEIVEIAEKIYVCRDPKDNKFLEVAVSGKADFIITGDKDLLVLNTLFGRQINIISDKIVNLLIFPHPTLIRLLFLTRFYRMVKIFVSSN